MLHVAGRGGARVIKQQQQQQQQQTKYVPEIESPEEPTSYDTNTCGGERLSDSNGDERASEILPAGRIKRIKLENEATGVDAKESSESDRCIKHYHRCIIMGVLEPCPQMLARLMKTSETKFCDCPNCPQCGCHDVPQ